MAAQIIWSLLSTTIPCSWLIVIIPLSRSTSMSHPVTVLDMYSQLVLFESLQQNGSIDGLQNICQIAVWPTYTKYDYKHIFSFQSLKKQGKYNLLHVCLSTTPNIDTMWQWDQYYWLLQSSAQSSHYNDEFVGTLDAPLFKTKSHQQYERKREVRERVTLLPFDLNSHKIH